MKKILIISVSAGAGHVQAARALEQTAKVIYPDHTVKHIDLMDYVTPALKSAIVDAYGFIVKNAPSLWQFIYKKTDNEKRLKHMDRLMKHVNQLNAKRLYMLLDEFSPDHVICTHSFPAQVIQQSKKKEHHNIPISLVVTDYGWHSYWVLKNITNYFVATEKMKWEMAYHHVDTPVYVTGIPVRPVFLEEKNIESLKKKYNVSKDKKIILILSGGQGIGANEEVIHDIANHAPLHWSHLIFIVGKNNALEEKLKTVQKKVKDITLDVIGWTDAMDEYMRIADVIVSKPGGSTTSECMALNKKMVAFKPIPGQEESNALHILENGFGYRAGNTEELLYYIERVLGDQKNSLVKKAESSAELILGQVIQ